MNHSNVCHEATIQKIEGHTITVTMQQSSACSRCQSKGICGMSEQRTEEIVIHHGQPDNFSVGERVQVHIRQTLAWKALCICYLFPFLVLFITFTTLYLTTQNDLISIGGSLGLTALYFLSIRFFRKKIEDNTQFFITKIRPE